MPAKFGVFESYPHACAALVTGLHDASPCLDPHARTGGILACNGGAEQYLLRHAKWHIFSAYADMGRRGVAF